MTHKEKDSSQNVKPPVQNKNGFEKEKIKAETAIGLTEQQIATLRNDFGEYSDKVFEIYRKERGKEPDFKEGKAGFWDFRTGYLDLYQYGIAWFGGDKPPKGFFDRQSIGSPEDYFAIKDDCGKMKEMISGLLSQGIFEIPDGHDANESDPSDYFIWLHKISKNDAFKENLEHAVCELLLHELDRDFAPLDTLPHMKKEEENLIWNEEWHMKQYGKPYTYNFSERDSLHDVTWRLGLDDPQSAEDKSFAAYVKAELGKTERPITLEEFLDRFAGSKEENRKAYETGEPAKRYKLIHYSETSEEFRSRLREYYIRHHATIRAVKEFSPQFYTLMGLLNIVSSCGGQENGLAEIYPMLKKKAEERFHKDSPLIDYPLSQRGLYSSILTALSWVQKGSEMREFWLDGIQNDASENRLFDHIHGLLMMYKTVEERQAEIPEILRRLSGRMRELDSERKQNTMLFPIEYNLLESLSYHIGRDCFEDRPFTYIDKEHATLYFLRSKARDGAKYSFEFDSFTQEGKSNASASFDLASNLFTGHAAAVEAARKYIDENGYEVSDKVKVAALEGTNKGKSMVDGSDLAGKYEGAIKLNSAYFAFRFDPETEELLLTSSIDRGLRVGGEDGWEARRLGEKEASERINEINKLTKKNINGAEEVSFMSLDSLAEKIRVKTASMGATELMFEPLHGLGDELNSNLSPAIAEVIKARLISLGDGMWTG
ncbi:Uncharacterised protein [uncultured archaeon]|nr:Uncharacterised protein [uncultured archaeon]